MKTDKVENNDLKIWVTVSETINTGNFNSVKIEAGYTKPYTEKQNPVEMLESEISELTDMLNRKAKKIRKKNA